MMDHVAILKKAWHVTLRHRSLWVLGFLWALVGGSQGFSFPNFSGNYSGRYGGDQTQMNQMFWQMRRALMDAGSWLLHYAVVLVALLAVLLFIGILFAIIRYVLQAGIYRVLYQLEVSDAPPTISAAFREGWHRRTWRLFLQNLIVGIPLVILVLMLVFMALAPLLLWTTGNEHAQIFGVVSTIGFLFLLIVVVSILVIIIGILSQFWWRAAVIDDMGALEAMGYAWRMVWSHLKDVAVMWLLMLGVGILFMLFVMVAMVVVGIMALLVAAAPGFLLYQLSHSLALALLWGIPVGLAVFLTPLFFLSGLFLIFQADAWTIFYLRITRPAEAPAAVVST